MITDNEGMWSSVTARLGVILCGIEMGISITRMTICIILRALNYYSSTFVLCKRQPT
jgi:hypothetical protein